MTNSAIAAAIEKARADERAAIVAWLREFADYFGGDEGPGALYNAADKIERGDHLK